MKISIYRGIKKISEFEAASLNYFAQDQVLHLVETCRVDQEDHLTIELSQEEIKNMLLLLAKMLK